MQAVPENYRDIWTQPHRVEIKALVNDVEYLEDSIVKCTVERPLMDGGIPTVGACVSAQLDLELLPHGEVIPPRAEVQLYCRLVTNTLQCDWIPQGVFFIDTRETSNIGNLPLLKIHAYDVIIKLDPIYLTGTITGWPKSMKAVALDIADIIGTTIDPRTEDILSDTFMCQINTTYTMRQYMGYIAAAHAGNWITTADGQLRLATVFDTPNPSHLLIDEFGTRLVFGDTRILI